METFEPTLWLIVKKDSIPVLVESFIMEAVTENNKIETDETFRRISYMLVEAGEPPLSKEEIFYYKLTKDDQ